MKEWCNRNDENMHAKKGAAGIMNVGAVIVAAQDLAQDKTGNEELETFLPMLPIEGTTVIKREINTLRKAGISPIIVVGGYQAAVLKNHISHNGVVFLEDSEYACHDWLASAEIGIEAAELCDKVILIAVEFPAFKVETLERLKECDQDTCLYYDGQPGRLQVRIGSHLTDDMDVTHGKQNLARLDTDDYGILYDITHPDQIEKVRDYIRQLRDARSLSLKTKIVLSKTEDFFGPGLFHLLQYIDETGSIQAAAKKMGMSYSKCWKLLNRAEEQMGFPFLNRYNGGRHGGNSTITEEGREFMNRYHAMLEDMKRISQNFFDIYFQEYQ
ncbi:MAG: LysR family transcriptional regulator [Lachnospiraceae bacterium]